MRFTVILLIFFSFSNLTQSQTFEWAKIITGDEFPDPDDPTIRTEFGQFNLLDTENNYYNFGSVFETADMDPGMGIFNITLNEDDNFYVQKLDSDGNFIWAFGLDKTQLIDVAIDQNANIYVAGTLYDTLDLDPSSGVYLLDVPGYNMYIAKYDSSGNFLWGTIIGDSTGNVYVDNICTDFNNNIYVTGRNVGFAFDIDPGPGTSIIDQNSSYVLKLDQNNNFIWARGLIASGRIIECGPDNNPVLYGEFFGTGINFDFNGPTYYMDSPSNGKFFMKFDENSNFIWAYKLEYGNLVVNDFAIDHLNDIYYTGYFIDSVDFNPSTGNIEHAWGNSDIYVQKVDVNGNFVWVETIGSSLNESGNSIGIDSLRNVYVGGAFTGTIDFDNGSGVYNLSSQGNFDYFLMKLDSSGDLDWAQSAGDSEEDMINSIAVDKSGKVYATGKIEGNIDVDASPYSYIINTQYTDVLNLKIGLRKPEICMVTVDTMSIYNIVYWDKSIMENIDSVFVFRETYTNTYEIIARISYDSAGLFIDTVSQQFFPFTGNPNMGTYRYKIQTLDIWGGKSPMSPYHNTIFATNNDGTFNWNDYLIEGQQAPIPQLGAYLLWRDELGNGNWQVIGAVAGTQTTITDPDYLNYPGGKWRILTDWTISCDPERTGVNTSRSNIKNTGAMNDISENEIIHFDIYPNPAQSFIIIENNNLAKNFNLEIYDGIGKLVKSESFSGNNAQCNIEKLSAGIYLLKISSSDGVVFQKLVID